MHNVFQKRRPSYNDTESAKLFFDLAYIKYIPFSFYFQHELDEESSKPI
jgi:hypothetical protein